MFFVAGVVLTKMASVRWHWGWVLVALAACLAQVASSLNLEDPNVCSHWER